MLVAILLLFGADALPAALRTLGRWTEQLRRISMDLQRELHEAEEPFHEIRRTWEEETKEFRVTGPDPSRPRSAEGEAGPTASDPGETNNEDT